jgi:hypothetical protein
MSGLFSPNIPKRANPTAPQAGDTAIESARAAQMKANEDLYGRQATLMTGGGGAAGTPDIGKKSLLGG